MLHSQAPSRRRAAIHEYLTPAHSVRRELAWSCRHSEWYYCGKQLWRLLGELNWFHKFDRVSRSRVEGRNPSSKMHSTTGRSENEAVIIIFSHRKKIQFHSSSTHIESSREEQQDRNSNFHHFQLEHLRSTILNWNSSIDFEWFYKRFFLSFDINFKWRLVHFIPLDGSSNYTHVFISSTSWSSLWIFTFL